MGRFSHTATGSHASGFFPRPRSLWVVFLAFGLCFSAGCATAQKQTEENGESPATAYKTPDQRLALLEDRMMLMQMQLDQVMDMLTSQAGQTGQAGKTGKTGQPVKAGNAKVAESAKALPLPPPLSQSMPQSLPPPLPQSQGETLPAVSPASFTASSHAPSSIPAPTATSTQAQAASAPVLLDMPTPTPLPDPVYQSSRAASSSAFADGSAANVGGSVAGPEGSVALPDYDLMSGGKVVPPPGGAAPAGAGSASAETILDDLDRTLTARKPAPVSGGGSRGASAGGASSGGASGGGNLYTPGADADYSAALRAFEAGRPQEAESMFRNFLEQKPGSSYAPNAQYWLGECLYEQKRYADAVLTFKEVVAQYPKHPKAAAAMLKMGFAYERMGDKDNAIFYLKALLSAYPGSEPAPLARKKLANLGA